MNSKIIIVIASFLLSGVLMAPEDLRVKRQFAGVPMNVGAARNFVSGQEAFFKDVIAEVAVIASEVVHAEKAVVEAVNTIEERVDEVVELIEHPITVLSKSKTGVAILVLASITVFLVVIRLAGPSVKMLWSFVVWTFSILKYIFAPVTWLFQALIASSCCITLCAFKPMVLLRNRWIAARNRKMEKKRMQTFVPGEEIQMVRKTYSALHTDEQGAYLLADDNHRVYMHSATQSEDIMVLKTINETERDKGLVNRVKESILSTSKLYKVDKLPDFQGQFEADGVTVGHFSRIKYEGKDCILTAYHVLDYNRAALLSLKKGNKAVRLDTVKARLVAASKTDELDFIIMEVPTYVFSVLGLKVGVWSGRIQSREPISIYQLYEGKPCVSNASINLNRERCWHIKYGASTTVGTSGAPILDARNRIVGVHLESDGFNSCNVGVIPPVFRNSKKESPMNDDLVQGEPDMVEVTPDDWYSKYEMPEPMEEEDDDYESELQSYYVYLKIEREEIDLDKPKNWADEMDQFDQFRMDLDREAFRVFRIESSAGSSGGHVNQQIKRGRFRKESPWTCSKCFVIQEKGHTCAHCGFCLIPYKSKKMRRGLEQASQLADTAIPLPREIKDIIMSVAERDRLIADISERVCKMLEANGENQWRKSRDESLYPPLNAVLEMDKKYAQSLTTNQSDLIVEKGKLKEKVGNTYYKDLCDVKVKKRTRKNTKKETVEVPQVPLKEKAPAALQTGEAITNGMNLKSSVNIQGSLEGVKSLSRNARRRKNRKSGSKPKSLIPV